MRRDYHALTCVNDDHTYTSFHKVFKAAWTRLGLKPVWLDYGGLPRINNLPSANLAKVCRMIHAGYAAYDDDVVMVVDADMIPLRGDIVAHIRELGHYELSIWGADHPAFIGADAGKWPMDRTAATSLTWRKIVNPLELPAAALIRTWRGGVDGVPRSDPFADPKDFSDESLLKALVDRYKKDTTKPIYGMFVPREPFEPGGILSGRLDRAKWDRPNIEERILAGEFFEVHGKHPFTDKDPVYRALESYFGGF